MPAFDVACIVQTVDDAAYPETPEAEFPCRRVEPEGDPAEAPDPALVASGPVFGVLNRGDAIPPPGAFLLAFLIDGRWTARCGR